MARPVHRKGSRWRFPKSTIPTLLGIYVVVTELGKASSNPAIVLVGGLMCNALPVELVQMYLENSVLQRKDDDDNA